MKSLIKSCTKWLSHILFLLPRELVRKMGALIGFLWIDVLRFRHEVMMTNLQIAFPDWSEEKKHQVARESVYSMGRGFFEFFLIPHMSEAWLEKYVVFEGFEHYQAALLKKKGVLLVSLHLGNGDLAASAVSLKGYPLSIITKIFKNKFFNDLWFSFRGGQGVRHIDAHGPSTAFDILKALKRNEGVIFVIDQFMGRPFGIKTRFFGKETGSAYGLALFTIKSKSPVVPIYTYEGNDQKMHVVFEPEIETQDLVSDDRQASILAMTQRFNDKIERIIRMHPEQWLWVHRRWKEFE
ncbi:MAG: lysophospholipid acyltransferase family protein [Bdellovibrionaceae bacterium]|nr:lysophospholipid acyltransferase family protein [Pseudobdellovibrionaceae bacterium]